MEHKDGTVSIRVETIEEFHISDSTKALTQKEKIEKLNEYFKKEYQGKVVEYDKDGESIRVFTTTDTRKNFSWMKAGVRRAQHDVKLSIAADGQYPALIANVRFRSSSVEEKSNQSLFHKKTAQWHYFEKTIICDFVRYDVLIDVRESEKHVCTIHNISLYPA